MRRHIIRGTLLLALGASLTGSASCTMREGTGNSYLIIDRLQGVDGQAGEGSSTLRSDVVALVERTIGGQQVEVETVFEDSGIATLRILPKDSASFVSPSNFVTINRYRVVYTRSDGRNTPGVDVPFPFDGTTTVTIAEGSTDVPFTLVRLQAKLESPLLGLRNLSGAGTISTMAQVTFFGQDQTGRAVSVTGTITVSFADWADKE